jgi:hypothetical protein
MAFLISPDVNDAAQKNDPILIPVQRFSFFLPLALPMQP